MDALNLIIGFENGMAGGYGGSQSYHGGACFAGHTPL